MNTMEEVFHIWSLYTFQSFCFVLWEDGYVFMGVNTHTDAYADTVLSDTAALLRYKRCVQCNPHFTHL